MIIITFLIGFLLTVVPIECKHQRKTILARKLVEIHLNHSIADSATTFTDLIRDSSMFIDKTLLIKEIIECSNSMLLIICPRGWGKSINLEMLKAFLQIEVDSIGKQVSSPSKAKGYRIFHKGEISHKDGSVGKLRHPLLISHHKELLNDYQGKYPVIYLNLKNVNGDCYNSVMRRVRTAISYTFNEHYYLMEVFKKIINDNSVKVKGTAEEDLKKFTKYLQQIEEIPNIEYSLHYLSGLLSEYFHKNAFVFVDEYDAPLRAIFQNPKFPKEDVKKTFMFFELLLGSVFKDNPYLEKGVATGTLRIAQQTLYSKWNNVVEHNFIHKPSSILQYYGLSLSDVDDLFQEHNVGPDLASQALDWYGGYSMYQNPHETKMEQYYHPASITKFLRAQKLESYWEEIETTGFIETVINKSPLIRDKISTLVNRRVILINIDHLRFSEEIMLELRELFHTKTNEKIPPHISDLFFAFLFKKGYLTACEDQFDSLTTIRAKLPNNEMHYEMTHGLIFYYMNKYHIEDSILNNAATNLKELVRDEVLFLFDCKDALRLLFLDMPPFEPLFKNISKELGHRTMDDFVASIVYVVAMKMQCMYQFDIEVYWKNNVGGDIFMFEKKLKRAIMLVIKYNIDCSETAMKEASQYQKFIEKTDYIDRSAYIGINVLQNKTVQISVQVDNPIATSEKVHKYSLNTTDIEKSPPNSNVSCIIHMGSDKDSSTDEY